MKKLLLASIAIVLLSTAASAADLAARPYTKAAPMVDPGVNWTGFYAGVMGGYGWSDHVRLTALGVVATGSGSDINGGFGGGTVGYNWQTGSWVFGLEADAAGADIAYSTTQVGVTFADKINVFGSATGRIGYASGAALFYAKGGYAWADNKLSLAAFGVGPFSETRFNSGWTVGGGVEYMFAPSWSAKAEYMYADYGNQTYLGAVIPGGIGFSGAFHTVKAGVNYHFGGPVVARY